MSVGARIAVPDDLRFISASWFESFWKGTMRAENVAFPDYKRGQDARIRALLARSTTYVAFPEEIPDEILGYAVVEGEVLHYVYVKSVYRRQGVARGLIPNRVRRFSHMTRGAKWIAASLSLSYDPYANENH